MLFLFDRLFLVDPLTLTIQAQGERRKQQLPTVITFDMFLMAAIEEDDELVGRHLVKVCRE